MFSLFPPPPPLPSSLLLPPSLLLLPLCAVICIRCRWTAIIHHHSFSLALSVLLDFEYVSLSCWILNRSLSCWILNRSEREDVFKIQQDGGSASAEVDRKIPGRRRVERRTHTSQTRATQDRTQRGGRGKRERDWRREKKKEEDNDN